MALPLAVDATAETLHLHPRPRLRLIQGGESRVLDADRIPELRLVRQLADQESAAMLEANRQQLRDGNFDAVPIPVDALGTARKVRQVEEKFGTNSPEHQAALRGLDMDCERLLAEAESKNGPEEFEPAEQEHDVETNHYYADGFDLLEIVGPGGLSPIAEPEEQQYRTDDYREERTYPEVKRIVGRVGLSGTVVVHTISGCTDWAIRAYEKNPDGTFGGYVPSQRKFIHRRVKIDDKSNIRLSSQTAIPGLLIDDEVIAETLHELNWLKEDEHPSKLELHGRQFVDTDPGDDFELERALDKKASEKTGKNVFMGQEVPLDHPKDYMAFRRASERRRLARKGNAKKLRNYVLDLEAKGTDRWQAGDLVNRFVKNMLLQEAEKDYEVALMTFDKKTADGLRRVAHLKRQGRHQEADQLRSKVAYEAPPPAYCGAGSCGLKKVSFGSKQFKAVKRITGTSSPEKMIEDTERTCANCGELSVVYDMEQNKKVCTNEDCEATIDI